jgi:hypothetical protein
LYEELQGELDEVEAALAQLQTRAPGPAKLKRKDAAPENTFAATNNLYKYPVPPKYYINSLMNIYLII